MILVNFLFGIHKDVYLEFLESDFIFNLNKVSLCS
jgi:hypothetical protein